MASWLWKRCRLQSHRPLARWRRPLRLCVGCILPLFYPGRCQSHGGLRLLRWEGWLLGVRRSGLYSRRWEQRLRSQLGYFECWLLCDPLYFLLRSLSPRTLVQTVLGLSSEETSILQSPQPELESSSCPLKIPNPEHQSQTACSLHSLPSDSPVAHLAFSRPLSPSSPAAPSSKPYSTYHL